MNNIHLLSPVSLYQRKIQPSWSWGSLVIFLELYCSITWHILYVWFLLLCHAMLIIECLRHPALFTRWVPSSATPPSICHSSTRYFWSRICRKFLLSVSRLWYAIYLSGALFMIERLDRKTRRDYEKFRTEMCVSKNRTNIVGWKKGNYEGSNLSSLLISHNTLQEIPEELCSAELLHSIENVYSLFFVKVVF